VVGALCALLITRDAISSLEWIAIVAISSGVTVACLPVRGKRQVAIIRETAIATEPRGSKLVLGGVEIVRATGGLR
jgi:hypothetical protein